jgi:HEAT repeat protein
MRRSGGKRYGLVGLVLVAVFLILPPAAGAGPDTGNSPPSVHALLKSAATAPETQSRVEAYRLLEDYGDREILGALIESLSSNPPEAKRPAERALVAVLRRSDDPESYLEIERRLGTLADEERARLVASVADADCSRGVTLLGNLIGRYREVDLAVLSGLARMTAKSEDPRLAETLCGLLESESSNLRREAISALGQLHHEASAEDFVRLLGGDHRGVAGNAHWALRRLSRLNLPPDPIRWNMWLGGERSWWEKNSEELLAILASGDKEALLRALHDLAMHPLYRAKFEEALRVLATDSDAEIRNAAKRALSELGLADDSAETMIRMEVGTVSMRPATDAEIKTVTAPLPPRKRPDSKSTSVTFLFLALGLPLCLTLFLKVGGFAPLRRIRSWWAEDQIRGPAVVKLTPRPDAMRRTVPPSQDRAPSR